MDEQFIRDCKNGNLDGIKRIIEIHNINIHAINECGFRWACDNGQFHIVEYLINLYKINSDYDIINIHAGGEFGFRWARHNGHLHVVEYLINLGSYLGDDISIIFL